MPGQRDFGRRLRISPKVYGRTAELERLRAVIAAVAAGQSSLTLIAGYSGVGKSTLVAELDRLRAGQGGLFISGKFQQYKRSIPYFAFVEAIEDFVDKLLFADDSTIEAFRSRFAKEIGDQGGVLTTAFPRLEALVGAQDPIEKLMGVEAENRFRFVFLRFVGLLATPEQPLLLFLDDLQWSDLVSLNIVKALALSRTPHLMLCLAYRDNEVDRQHPFQHALDELAAADLPIERIQVGDLSLADIASLIADTLRTPHPPLARMVHAKTHGNSFFVHQHARALQGGDRLRARDPDATRHPPLARAAAHRARRRAGRGPCRARGPWHRADHGSPADRAAQSSRDGVPLRADLSDRAAVVLLRPARLRAADLRDHPPGAAERRL